MTDANEAPAFTSSATFSVAENTTAVGAVTASDPDATDSVTGYSLSGTDATLFQITSAGVLTFKAAPDFEAPQGGTGNNSNSYALTVTATGGTGDRALTTTQDLTVTVTNVNERPGAPGAVGQDQAFEHQVTVRWNLPSDDGGTTITEYDLEYRRKGTSGWSDSDDEHPRGGGAFWAATVRGLRSETAYEWRVRARNSVGWGPYSPVSQVNTNDNPVP